MATYGQQVRQGLPRVAGGAPWPQSGTAPIPDGVAVEAAVVEPAVTEAAAPGPAVVAEAVVAETAAPEAVVTSPASAPVQAVRRGLPRVAGGDAWPPAGTEAAVPAAAVAAAAPAPVETPAPAAPVAAQAAPGAPVAQAQPVAEVVTGGGEVRRGLPRVAGGDPWPPAGSVPVVAAPVAPATEASTAEAPAAPAPGAPAAETPVEAPTETAIAARTADLSQPLPFRRTVTVGQYANTPVVEREPKRIGAFTRAQWAGIVVVGGGALLSAAFLAVTFVQWIISLQPVADFITIYPGEYELPEGSTPGFPVWAQWQHYFNVFLMVLIIRSGLTVRHERRPNAFWTPAWSKNGRGKISLTLWFHQALDLLWVINGAVFIVLLFVSNHWMRLVPTSWEVFPNALSALLQYISLDWPTEHGWVNYNSLQQIMYFSIVFIAAPLAIISGVRMSALWPKKAQTLNKLYPVEVARAIHYPVMLFFVAFIVVHVVLVLSTGALRNLNHMFAGNDQPDNWAGFWIFMGGMVVIIAAWAAVRPLVLAPIAKLFGKVSMR